MTINLSNEEKANKGKIEDTINISDFIVSLTGLGLGHNGCKKNKKDHKGQTRKIIKRPETLRHVQTERKSQVV